MQTRFLMIVVASLLVLAGCGDPDGPIESMTLYSLNGEDQPPPNKPWKGETFHGFGVVGKTEIASASDRLAILTAVKRGIAQSDGSENKCFWPHHGVSLVQNGKTIEYVICFHCLQLQRFADGASKTIATTASPSDTLDDQLKKAGVPVHEDSSTAE
jgi:hypothetical protein